MACKNIWDIGREAQSSNVNEVIQKSCVISSDYQLKQSLLRMGLKSSLIKGLEHSNLSMKNKVLMEFLSFFSQNTDRNLVLYAMNQSGKTSAIILAVLNQLLSDRSVKSPRAIMLCPIYELAETSFQIAQSLAKFCLPISIKLAVKGKGIKKGEKVIEDLIIGTPEKILDLADTSIDLQKVEILILDECNTMTKIRGHYNNILFIYKKLPSKCKVIFSSPSKSENLEKFIQKCVPYPSILEIPLEKATTPSIKQIYLLCQNIEEKVEALIYVEALSVCPGQTVVFCETKDNISRVDEMLQTKAVPATILIGGKTGLKICERKQVLEQFRDKTIKVLLTTRAFVNVISTDYISKIINLDQVMDEEYHLVSGVYKERENLLRGKKEGLIINCIEKKWAQHLLSPKVECDGKKFCNGIEIINYDELIDYFSV